jgi:hypothetical protein
MFGTNPRKEWKRDQGLHDQCMKDEFGLPAQPLVPLSSPFQIREQLAAAVTATQQQKFELLVESGLLSIPS